MNNLKIRSEHSMKKGTRQLTPKQVARAIGVSEASLKRWCDKGLLPSSRTEGGHRRLPFDGVIQFVRDRGHPLVRPELLGLPSAVGKGKTVFKRAQREALAALEEGDEERFRRVIFDLYLSKTDACTLCDDVIANAFHQIGDRWEHGDLEIYQERRGVEIVLRVLHELRRMLQPIHASAPRALGGTVQRDPYTIPTTMVELVLREHGWNAENCGALLPFETIQAALEKERPRLAWVSVSWIEDQASFLTAYDTFYRRAEALGVAVLVGGRAMSSKIRANIRYAAHCEKLKDVVAFATALQGTP